MINAALFVGSVGFIIWAIIVFIAMSNKERAMDWPSTFVLGFVLTVGGAALGLVTAMFFAVLGAIIN